MKRIFVGLAVIAAMSLIPNVTNAQAAGKAATSSTAEKSAIEQVVKNYQDALNAGDVAKVTALYAEDAVQIPNAAPTAEGLAQIKGGYQYVLDNFGFNLKFTILDVQVTGNTAVARSTSKGDITIKAKNQTVPDEFRELWAFKKVGGKWKIARYMYNKAK